jgi:hypothetical protein
MSAGELRHIQAQLKKHRLGISKQLLCKVCLLSQLLCDFYVASFALQYTNNGNKHCDRSRYQYACAMVSGRLLRFSFDMKSCENLSNCH